MERSRGRGERRSSGGAEEEEEGPGPCGRREKT